MFKIIKTWKNWNSKREQENMKNSSYVRQKNKKIMSRQSSGLKMRCNWN